MGNVNAHDGYKIGGHSWNMVDEETGSNLVLNCQKCHAAFTSYDSKAPQDYDGDGVINGYQTETLGLLDTLRTLLAGAGYLKKQPDGSYLPANMRVPRDIAGCVWNYLFIEDDRSEGVHNFKYEYGLLKSSIDYLKAHLSPAMRAPVAEL